MAIFLNNQGVRTPPERGLGIRVHTFRRGRLVKFRKSPHRTKKALRHARKPATPRSANPIGPESTSFVPGKDPPMANPPRARKMTPERPFPVLPVPSRPLLRLAKVTPKRSFSRRFPYGFPTVSQRFCQRFPSGSTAVFQPFCQRFANGSPTVFQRFAGGSTAVFRRFSNGFPTVFQRFSSGFGDSFPPVYRRFDSGFRRFCQRFSGGFANGFPPVCRWFDSGFPAVRRRRGPPGSTPVRPRPPPSSERNCRQIRTQFQAYKPSIAAFSKVCL